MPLTDHAKEIIDCCLLCTNCVQTCSSKVPIDEIIIAARSEMHNSTGDGLRKFVMNKMLSKRGLTATLGKAGALV
ncbi:MAG: hypothetical protein U9N81_08525 [Bacillota bacterium]|nr:hypothetical protein [Bacillota bacterium]